MPLRNNDMTDRELLIAIKHAAGGEGIVAADELAYDLGFIENGHGQPQKVTSRCAYMIRQGWLNRVYSENHKGYVCYQISDAGHALISGRVSVTVQRSINSSSRGDQLLIMRELAVRAFSDPDAATAVRREFEHHRGQR